MRPYVLALAVAPTLAACRASSPAPAEPPSAIPPTVEALVADGERPQAFDVAGFEPPFERVPLSAAFVRAHGLRRIVVHVDANTEDAQLVDVEVTTLDYDRAGRRLRSSTAHGGETGEEVRYEHADGRLVAELRSFPDGTRHAAHYAYDAEGRVQRVEHDFPRGTLVEERAYDERGRLDRVTRIEDDGRAEQRFFYEREQLRRAVLSLPEGRVITTEHTYDASGRPTQWVRTDTTRGVQTVDTHAFTWDARGQLRTQSFTEGDAPIYRRTYAYDEDGRPLREELQSFVPAMGRGSLVRYEYERHEQLPRRAATPARSEPTKAELLAATVGAFRGAYEELAVVAFESGGEDRFTPGSVTVYVPAAIVGQQSESELEQQACAAKRTLGWDCDCEWVTLGEPVEQAWHAWADKRVVPLTLHFGRGC